MNELEQRIDALENFVLSLKANATIPIEIDNAFRERLAGTAGVASSSKSATSENQVVNESGSSTYSVLKAPDLFAEVQVGGSILYLPAFT